MLPLPGILEQINGQEVTNITELIKEAKLGLVALTTSYDPTIPSRICHIAFPATAKAKKIKQRRPWLPTWFIKLFTGPADRNIAWLSLEETDSQNKPDRVFVIYTHCNKYRELLNLLARDLERKLREKVLCIVIPKDNAYLAEPKSASSLKDSPTNSTWLT